MIGNEKPGTNRSGTSREIKEIFYLIFFLLCCFNRVFITVTDVRVGGKQALARSPSGE